MYGLEQGINQLANQETNQKVRSTAIDLLNGIIGDLNAGMEIWRKFLESGGSSAKAGSYGGWAGFSIETKLFELDLSARDKAKQASAGKSSLDDPLVVLAYSMLDESVSANEQAQNAISSMQSRIDKIKGLIEIIKNTKPKKVSSSQSKPKAAKSKPAKKKSASKKSKKAAKKKPATKKKAAKKKAAKKKSKKKAVKKKAAKKKAAKKKSATKKKTTKKKATKKKASQKKKAAKKKKAKRR